MSESRAQEMTATRPNGKAPDPNDSSAFLELACELSSRLVHANPGQVHGEIRDGTRRALQFFDADRCALLQVDPETGKAEVHEGVEPADTNSLPKTVDGGELFPWLFEQCIRQGQTVRLDSVADLPAEAMTDRQNLSHRNIRSLLAIPLQSTNAHRYLIAISSLSAERAWPEAHIPRLRLLGASFVDALQRTATDDMEREAFRFEDLIADLSARFVGGLPEALDEEVVSALSKIREFFDADQCGIFEIDWNRDAGSLRYVASAPGIAPPPAVDDWRSRVPWLYERLVKRGEAVVSTRQDDLPPEASVDHGWHEANGLRSCASVPLFVDTRVRYVLSLATNRHDRRWAERHVKRLRALGELFVKALNLRDAVEALHSAQRSLVEAQRVGNVGSWEWEVFSDRVDTSHQAQCILGFNPATFQEFMGIVHPADRSALEETMERGLSQEGGRRSVQYRICRPDGQERVLDNWYEVVCAKDGGSPRVIGTVQDITDKRRTEEELQSLRTHYWHADRIARLGVLGTSLAHELSQPLAAILSNAQAALRLLAAGKLDDQETREILLDIVADDKRAGEVIAALRSMLRRQRGTQSRVDAGEIVDEVLKLVNGEIVAQQIEVRADCAQGCHLTADRTQILQVVMNLVLNSVDAMRETPPAKRRLDVQVSASAPGGVVVSVRDSGRGIAPEALERVFDAFWTTKGQGLGMGLALCRSIVENHGGRIWAESEIGRGTTVSFSLPPAD